MLRRPRRLHRRGRTHEGLGDGKRRARVRRRHVAPKASNYSAGLRDVYPGLESRPTGSSGIRQPRSSSRRRSGTVSLMRWSRMRRGVRVPAPRSPDLVAPQTATTRWSGPLGPVSSCSRRGITPEQLAGTLESWRDRSTGRLGRSTPPQRRPKSRRGPGRTSSTPRPLSVTTTCGSASSRSVASQEGEGVGELYVL